MDCPKCVGRMQHVSLSAPPAVFQRCPVCGGIWFEGEELSRLVSERLMDKITPDRVEEGGRFDESLMKELALDEKETGCPSCEGHPKMKKISSPRDHSVTIDICPRCGGNWLDHGEFARISSPSVLEKKFADMLEFFRSHFPHLFGRPR
ncbi:MAG: zf-TFIIB domain-containing protein [Deltaproteobacteria bacterium]